MRRAILRACAGSSGCPPLLRPFRRSINLPIGDYASGLYLVTVNRVQDRIVIHTDSYRGDLLDRHDFP